MEMNMRLIGAATIDDLNTAMVDHRGLSSHGHIQTVPRDNLGMANYEQLTGPKENPVMAKI
jgi:L-lactate dehydrogenase (cytochrome)